MNIINKQHSNFPDKKMNYRERKDYKYMWGLADHLKDEMNGSNDDLNLTMLIIWLLNCDKPEYRTINDKVDEPENHVFKSQSTLDNKDNLWIFDRIY